MRRSQIIAVSIDCPLGDAYGYLARPVNYETWAAVEPGSFRPLANGDWSGQTAFGFRHVRFTEPNAFGVLDHAIFVPGEKVQFNPMRVTANEDGSDLTFTFFQREGVNEAQFASSIEWITTDLLTLKSLLETLFG